LSEEPDAYVRQNRQALEATRRLDPPDRYLLAVVLGNLGNGLVEIGELDEAEEAFERSLEIGESLDKPLLSGLASIGLAEVRAVREDESWVRLAEEAREMLDAENTGFDLLRNMLDLAERAIDHGFARAGLRELESVRSIVEDQTFHNLHAKFYELRAEAFERMGDYQAALEALRESTRWRERHHRESVAQLRRPLDSVVQGADAASTQDALLDELAEAEKARRELAVAAYTDPLTQLPNRRAFDRRAPEEFRNSGQDEAPLAMAILDLDHFKDVNDEYGHLVGDDALRRVADRIEDAVRSTDFVARLGGEEFAILMPDTTDGEARTVAQRVRRVLEEMPVLTGEHRVEVTASVGVAARWEDDTLDSLLQRADEALYQAKERGRNRVELLEDSG
jgi:diguanylate cyclase (GGDEF)-like protein